MKNETGKSSMKCDIVKKAQAFKGSHNSSRSCLEEGLGMQEHAIEQQRRINIKVLAY